MSSLAQLPSSLTPTTMIPGWRWFGKSFAQAQIAWRILVLSEIDALRSTRSDSGSASSCSSSSSVKDKGVPPDDGTRTLLNVMSLLVLAAVAVNFLRHFAFRPQPLQAGGSD